MTYRLADLVEAMRLEEGASVSRALGISGTKLTQYAVNGLDLDTAERLCERVGFLVYEVFPQVMSDAIAELERECESPDCSTRFILKWRGAHRRYCSDNCRDRTNSRKRYQTIPEVRDRKRAAVAKYEAEVRALRERRAS